MDADKELARHLSQNQVLHIYNETQEEQLVSILRDLQDAKAEGGKIAVSKCLEAQHQKATINRNTKLTKVLKHTRLMTVLMEDILPFGPHYRTRREFDVTWLSKSINVVMGVRDNNLTKARKRLIRLKIYAQYMSHSVTIWRYIGTKTSVPLSLEKVKQSALEALDDDPDVSEAGATALEKLSDNYVALKDDDCLVFLPMLQEIDDSAARCFKAYDGCLGARHPDYEEALERYRTDVVNIMDVHFSSGGHRNAEEKQIHEDVMARAWGWLSDSRQDRLRMPLMTGYVMDRVWKELNAAKDGYTEVSATGGEKNGLTVCSL